MVIIYIAFFLIIVGGAIFWLWLESKFKCRVRLKELVKGRKIIYNFRARYHTDDTGVSWWRLAGEKDKKKRLIPLPPESAIELDKKGRKCVDCYRFESGEIIYSADEWDVKDFPDEILLDVPKEIQAEIAAEEDKDKSKQILTDWMKIKRKAWLKDNKIIKPFQPMTTKQRLLYVQNIKKAEARKGFSWKENAITLVSLGAMAMVLICLMVFWGDIAAPALAANEQANTGHNIQLQTMEILKEIKTNQQKILGETATPPPG